MYGKYGSKITNNSYNGTSIEITLPKWNLSVLRSLRTVIRIGGELALVLFKVP